MQNFFLKLLRKKSDFIQDCGAIDEAPKVRDQKVEVEPGRCWSQIERSKWLRSS